MLDLAETSLDVLTWCENLYSICIGCQRSQGSAIQTCLYLIKHCGHFFVCQLNVSSNVVTLFKCALKLFTAASHKPPKWGERSGMNFQTIHLDEQNSETRPWTCCWSRKSENSFNSRLAPTKLVPWSLQIIDGWPLREVKRLRAAMNDFAVRSEINSKWTALIVMDTNTPT